MNENQNHKSSGGLSRMFKIWLIFFVASALMIIVANLMPPAQKQPLYVVQALIVLIGSFFMLGLWYLIRWCCNPRNLGRFLVGTASFATIVAVFYMEEDWRGKRAWLTSKAELEAKGTVMDWSKLIPPAVPDDQNFFTASTNILLRFKKAQTDEESKVVAQLAWLNMYSDSDSLPVMDSTKSKPLIVAELTFVPSANSPDTIAKASSVTKFSDPATRGKIRELLEKTIGRGLAGSTGIQISEFQLSSLVPARMVLQADPLPTAGELESFIPSNLATNFGLLKVEALGNTGTFQVLLTNVKVAMHVTAAADYLKWSDQFEPAFDEVREALKRPSAIIPGDYSRPYLIPIPNFVTLRAMAQMLAQRAQCDFLLGKPDQALREMTLMHDVCRILMRPPIGKPITLVEAMINVAINGVYAPTIADGLRLHAWQEPQLITLQQQLQSVTLPRFVAESIRDEVIASCYTLEISTPAEKLRFLRNGDPNRGWLKLISSDFWLVHLAPRGWYFQNMAAYGRLSKNKANAFDQSNNLILPEVSEANFREITGALRHWSPWNFWAAIASPNLIKATQTTAYNQTLVNEAQVACALERYHLAHGEYPITLDALVPDFIEQLPHDIIGGQPLHYHRVDDPSTQGSATTDVNYLLYSVGWNGTDDGGTPGTLADAKKGDWVWKR